MVQTVDVCVMALVDAGSVNSARDATSTRLGIGGGEGPGGWRERWSDSRNLGNWPQKINQWEGENLPWLPFGFPQASGSGFGSIREACGSGTGPGPLPRRL